MKRNVILTVMVFVMAIMSVNLFAQTSATSAMQADTQAKIKTPLTGSEMLANILADAKRVPLELYPPSYLEYLKELGNNPLPVTIKVKRSLHSMNRMGPNGPQPMIMQPVYDYTVVDLGTLSGGNYSQAFGINTSGQVVGQSYTSDGPAHPFLYSGGVMYDISAPNTYGVAFAINDSSQIVGYWCAMGNNLARAFLYSGGVMQDLGTLGGQNSYGQGINNSGQVVGYSQISSGSLPRLPVFWFYARPWHVRWQ